MPMPPTLHITDATTQLEHLTDARCNGKRPQPSMPMPPSLTQVGELLALAMTLLDLGKVGLTGRSSVHPGVDQDELTEAEINSVCETPSAPQKSNQK
jgi:hypothetical protein